MPALPYSLAQFACWPAFARGIGVPPKWKNKPQHPPASMPPTTCGHGASRPPTSDGLVAADGCCIGLHNPSLLDTEHHTLPANGQELGIGTTMQGRTPHHLRSKPYVQSSPWRGLVSRLTCKRARLLRQSEASDERDENRPGCKRNPVKWMTTRQTAFAIYPKLQQAQHQDRRPADCEINYTPHF